MAIIKMKNKVKKYFITAIACMFIAFNSSSQDSGETTLGSWNEITISNRISDKISISGSLTNWNYELFDNQQLLLGIVGVNYDLSKSVTIGIGFGNGSIDTTFEDTDSPYIQENRFLEQISIKHNANKIAWNHRFRLEQRFLEFPTDDELKHRIRYRFKGTIPINKTLFITAYNEIHFNLNEFDFHQNRAYAALGAKLNRNINVQVGYARHSYKTKSFNRLSLQVNLKFVFRKEN